MVELEIVWGGIMGSRELNLMIVHNLPVNPKSVIEIRNEGVED
jgi:hypothetical protein